MSPLKKGVKRRHPERSRRVTVYFSRPFFDSAPLELIFWN